MGLLGSTEGAGVKTWAAGLLVWPAPGFGPGLNVVEAGRPPVSLGLLLDCGLVALGGSGLSGMEEDGRVGSGLGLA